MPSYWTPRYNAARIADEPVHLSAPLKLGWKYKPKGVGLGFIRAGHGDVFTTVGARFRVSRVNLRSGRAVWLSKEETDVSLLTEWDSGLLIWGDSDEAKVLAPKTGRLVSSRKCPSGLGLQDSFIVGDIFVGCLAHEFHAIDLRDLRVLWAVPEYTSYLVSDGKVVVRADAEKGITAFDLSTGKERWRREEPGGAGRLSCVWNGVFIVGVGQLRDFHLTAFDLKTGKTVWRWKIPYFVHWWHPYGDGRAYLLFDEPERRGVYGIIDLREGKLVFEKLIGPGVPQPIREKKKGLTYGTRGVPLEQWRDVRIVVSETHAFVQNNASGQIVVLKRDTGEVEQIVEIDAQPTGAEPVIYENRLLLTDFNATVHCFAGAGSVLSACPPS